MNYNLINFLIFLIKGLEITHQLIKLSTAHHIMFNYLLAMEIMTKDLVLKITNENGFKNQPMTKHRLQSQQLQQINLETKIKPVEKYMFIK